MTKTLSTLQLPLNTNCLASCPSSEDKWLAAGCYELSACRTVRHGGLHILVVAGSSEEGLNVAEVCSTNLPGIFDMKWTPGFAGSAQLGLALSDGSIGILTPSIEERSLGPLHSLMIDTGDIATCIAFSARDECTLAASTASGHLGLAQVTESALALTQKFQAHDSEIWSCAFSPLEAHVLISGADDCVLKTWDIRSSCRSASGVNRCGHKAGICCIQASSSQEHVIFTGSYDEICRSWDLRNLRCPTGEIALGGGVWRIRLHPAEPNKFVAACMYSGCAMVTTHVLVGSAACQMQIVQEYKSHESIAYDVDWVHLGKGEYVAVSCSFYDNKLHFWTVEQSLVP